MAEIQTAAAPPPPPPVADDRPAPPPPARAGDRPMPTLAAAPPLDDAALDAWLGRALRAAHDGILAEPVPERLLAILGVLPPGQG